MLAALIELAGHQAQAPTPVPRRLTLDRLRMTQRIGLTALCLGGHITELSDGHN
jgi:hypothetical protein